MNDLGIRYDLQKNSLVISEKLFDPNKFRFNTSDYKWNYRTKRREWVDSFYEIYTFDKKKREYLIPIGMLMYFYNTVENPSKELCDWCEKEVRSNIKLYDQDILFQEQWEDLQYLVSFKRGINQSYTGSGKTHAIGVLVKNLLKYYQGNILVAGPKNMVLDEIKSRLEGFGVYRPSYFDNTQRVNCINPNGICQTNAYEAGEYKTWLESVRFVICDEVDKLSDSSIQIMHQVETAGCKYFWGFSATAKKDDAAQIPATNQLMSIMNYDLLAVVSTFSHSVIYKLPIDFEIQINKVDMGVPDLGYLSDDIGDDPYKHAFGYYTNRNYIRFLKYVMTKCKPLVPIYYTTVIEEWTKLFPDKRLIVLRGSGYFLIQNNEVLDDLGIDDLKYIVSVGDFDAIFTTVSGFAALDCPELRDVILLSGTSAGSVIQYIGRVARKKKFTIWYASHPGKVPIITRIRSAQLDLIKQYYRLCEIINKNIKYGE